MRQSFHNQWQRVALLSLLVSWAFVSNAGAGEEALVKLKQFKWLPHSADLRSDAKKGRQAKWEVQIPTVQLVSPSEKSEIAEYSTSVDLVARSAALKAWDNTGKQIRK